MENIVKKVILALITSTAVALCVPATALAGGSNYLPPAPAPVITPNPISQTSSPATKPTCTVPTAPVMTVTSPDGHTINQNQPGFWTVVLNPGDDFADWQVSWTSSPGATYSFEVSETSTTDPSTGQFTSPIAADSVSGSQTTSNAMHISIEDLYYFHVKATACGKDAYSSVEQIDTVFNEQVPSTLASHNGNGTKGLQLLSVAAILGAAFAFAKRTIKPAATISR